MKNTRRGFMVKKNRIILLLIFCLAITGILLVGCGEKQSSDNQPPEGEDGMTQELTLEDLEGMRAGVMTGTPQDEMVKASIDNVELNYFNNFSDMALALREGKIDFYVNSTISFRMMQEAYPDFVYINSVIKQFDIGTIFPKGDSGEALCEQYNEYIKKIKDDGTLEELQNYWLYVNDWQKVDIPSEGSNGTLKMATISTNKPFAMVIGRGYSGFDVAIAAGFCKEYGYGLKIEDVDFAGLLAGISAGKYDFAASQISYTEERAEQVKYSDFYCTQDIVAIVNSERIGIDTSGTGSDGAGSTFWDRTKASFNKTFIEDSRYKMIFSGLGVTLYITIFGFILANILGVIFCMMARSRRRILNVLYNIYSLVMQGTPIVVILMILYYIIFGNSSISGTSVAIVGFGITTGAFLAQTFNGAVGGVDRGQWEAGMALGLSKFNTFKGIVLPQAIRTMLPGYFSELIALMKGTAIVGYIAVTDMTKAGDIIRSSTYEAFFPLISVAIIYFAIACILILIMKSISRKLEPKRIGDKKGGGR